MSVPDQYVLSGARELRPLVQGNLSRLCGLYSIINGIRLALYPDLMSEAQLQATYLEGIRYLAHRRLLTRVIGVGMTPDIWLPLAHALVEHTNCKHGSHLVVTPLFDAHLKKRGQVFAAIRKAISNRSPVLACFDGELDHYTVLAGYSAHRLKFFDSSGLMWITFNAVGLNESSGRRHWLAPSSVVALDDW